MYLLNCCVVSSKRACFGHVWHMQDKDLVAVSSLSVCAFG
jgi:hypothetical protein